MEQGFPSDLFLAKDNSHLTMGHRHLRRCPDTRSLFRLPREPVSASHRTLVQ